MTTKYELIAQGRTRNPYVWGVFPSLKEAEDMRVKLSKEQNPYFIFWVKEENE